MMKLNLIPMDFVGNVHKITEAMAILYPDIDKRIRNTFTNLRAQWRGMMEQLRTTFLGEPGDPNTLLGQIEQIQKSFINFVRRIRPVIAAVGNAVGKVITAVLSQIRLTADTVFSWFGSSIEEMSKDAEAFNNKVITPITVRLINTITYLGELFRTVLSTMKETVTWWATNKEAFSLARKVSGGALIALGAMTGNPLLALVGAGLLAPEIVELVTGLIEAGKMLFSKKETVAAREQVAESFEAIPTMPGPGGAMTRVIGNLAGAMVRAQETVEERQERAMQSFLTPTPSEFGGAVPPRIVINNFVLPEDSTAFLQLMAERGEVQARAVLDLDTLNVANQ
jgi:hypothetical protein